jgi:uncharacterized integral membrane protein
MNERNDVDQISAAVRRRDTRRLMRLLVVLLILGALVAVAVDNRDDVRIGYVFGDATGPIWLVITCAAIAGLVIGWLLAHRSRTRD